MANQREEHIAIFHLDCLCSDVRRNGDFDLTLTVLADLPYHNSADRQKGFAQAVPSNLFRKIVDTPGTIEIMPEGVVVRLSKRADNPLLKEAGLMGPTRAVPCLGGGCVHLTDPGPRPTEFSHRDMKPCSDNSSRSGVNQANCGRHEDRRSFEEVIGSGANGTSAQGGSKRSRIAWQSRPVPLGNRV